MADCNPQKNNEVTVVYALPEAQYLVGVRYTPAMTAIEAVTRSGLRDRFPEIAHTPLVFGLFGRQIQADQPLERGDRIEICRPLQRSPRELRRLMTSQGMVVGQREPGQS